MESLFDELERRFGDTFYPPDYEWREGALISMVADNLDIARAALAKAPQLESLFLFCPFHPTFGFFDELSEEPLAPLDELLALVPLATTVHASGQTVTMASHDRLETLSLVTRTWPLAAVTLPALQRLELCITDSAVTHDQLTTVLEASPRLTELVLRGAGFAGLALDTLPYPPNLSLVVDVDIELNTGLALAESPGTLARLGQLELRTKSSANRIALAGLEQAIPVATNGDRLACVTRWAVVERGCFGPIDPTLRIWGWQTREEGRSSGWVGFLPTPRLSPREADLRRGCDEPGGIAVYADWLEQTGQLERAIAIRTAGLPFSPQTLPEAMAILACAWKRVSSGYWIRDRVPGTIDPLSAEDFQRYTDMFAGGEHPLVSTHTVEPASFDEHVRSLVEMMREPKPATLRENEWLVRDDVATFTPPIGRARTAIALRDKWNDQFLAAETEHGYALLIWGTGA